MNNRLIGAGLIVAGAILGWFGYQESQSFGSQISSTVTGNPTDSAMWMLIAGAVLLVVGIGLTYRSFR